MRKPTPVTTSIITPLSASMLKATSIGIARAVAAAGRVHPLPRGPRELHVLRRFSPLGELRRGARNVTTARDEGAADGGERHQAHAGLAEALAEDAVHEGAEQRQREDEREEREVCPAEN